MQRTLLACSLPVLLAASCTSPETGTPAPTTDFEGAPYHSNPIVEEDGRTLLWANEDEWFDVTDASINPATFQHGIGKDRIASIDEPRFVRANGPRLEAATLTLDTPVLGVVQAGQAKAYPVFLMDRHEIVNDEFGGEAFAILW